MFSNRFNQSREVFIRFNKAVDLAKIYLPSDVLEKVEDITNEWTKASVDLELHALMFEQGASSDRTSIDAHQNFFGSKTKWTEKEKQLIAILRPIAQGFVKSDSKP